MGDRNAAARATATRRPEATDGEGREGRVDAVRAVTEPRRREILRLVWNAERTAGDIAASFDVTFGAISQHLRVLRDADLVTTRKEGKRRLYRANRETLRPFEAMLEQLWREQLDRLATLAEAAQVAEGTKR